AFAARAIESGARFFEGGAGARRVDAGRFDAVIGSTCCCARHCTQRRVADTGRQRTGRRQPRRRIGAVGRQRAWRALSGPAESRRLAGPHRGRTLPPGHSSDGRRCVAVCPRPAVTPARGSSKFQSPSQFDCARTGSPLGRFVGARPCAATDPA
ncbi:hypothetical protein, partial [Burkholderia multivorans]|uniref:hypothetical protein n=1 Tax=Burkholderia multivorans TaxID=87883 RepID=UPI0028702122